MGIDGSKEGEIDTVSDRPTYLMYIDYMESETRVRCVDTKP